VLRLGVQAGAHTLAPVPAAAGDAEVVAPDDFDSIGGFVGRLTSPAKLRGRSGARKKFGAMPAVMIRTLNLEERAKMTTPRWGMKRNHLIISIGIRMISHPSSPKQKDQEISTTSR
jgi:hypothetical protein